MKIGNIFENLINGTIVNEEKMNVSHLNETTILINRDNKLILYDINYLNSDEPIDGVVGFVVVGFEDGQAYMEMVASKKGFGPLMYELAMQYVSPSSLTPDIEGNTSEAALRMWDYFFKGGNSDVTIAMMSENDPLFRKYLGKYNIEDNPEIMKLFNSRYTIDNTDDLYYLEARTEDFLDEVDDPREISKKIMFLGNDFFNEMY